MPAFDPLTYRYASRRNVVYAKNAVACTSVPLGAQIGLDVMKSGLKAKGYIQNQDIENVIVSAVEG